jgi:hypothetical protein
LRIDAITIFPEYFDALGVSLLGKARDAALVETHVHNLRDWTTDVHHTVDDSPFGGGAGMVMKADVWGRALDPVEAKRAVVAGPAAEALDVPDPVDGDEAVRLDHPLGAAILRVNIGDRSRDAGLERPSKLVDDGWVHRRRRDDGHGARVRDGGAERGKGALRGGGRGS